MKHKRLLILISLLSICFSACGGDNKDKKDDLTYFNVNTDCVTNYFASGDSISLSSASEESNFLILDEQYRIMYTAAYVGNDYGTRLTSYYSSLIEDKLSNLFSSNKVKILEGMTGYEISKEGYLNLMIEISNNKLSLNDLTDPNGEAIKNWNSKNNEYIKNNMAIKFKENIMSNTRNKVAFRLSSIYDNFDGSGNTSYLMEAPYNDNYEIGCKNCASLKIYNENGDELTNTEGVYSFKKGDKVLVKLTGEAFEMFDLTVSPEKHKVELPYNVLEYQSLDSYDTTGNSKVDPLEDYKLKVAKRDDGKGLYVNCNNPEALYDDCLNTVLTCQDVTNKQVFFTYEHNNKISTNYYYAYRVTNTGEDDIFITVKNFGNHLSGDGSWLGEDEWIQFYNLPFNVRCLKDLNESQLKNFDAYIGFSNKYKPEERKPITYRVPKGKYIYVLGGTTTDAYKNINVFNSADKPVNSSISGCSNGAVLFEVSGGSAFGQFMAYSDRDARTINASPYVTEHKQYGYSKYIKVDGETKDVGSQYAGYDTCHGVVDSYAEWIFNDKTTEGMLPVTYRNDYFTNSKKGTPYGEVQNMVGKDNEYASSWTSHINPCNVSGAVGVDMTRYITTDHDTGEDIIITPERYDGKGETANIGNWMVDYIDTLTFVNQGDTDRKVTFSLSHNGVICAFVRDENGEIDEELYPATYQVNIAGSSYGQAIRNNFEIELTIPAHSVKRISVDYNLCANSCGSILHKAYLK